MSYSDRLKDIHDKETSEIDESFYIERNCSLCNTCMKVSIKHLPKKRLSFGNNFEFSRMLTSLNGTSIGRKSLGQQKNSYL